MSSLRQKDSRVEWLYSGPASTVNREEYLLGKKIDKFVDPTLTEEAREKEVMFTFQRFQARAREMGLWINGISFY